MSKLARSTATKSPKRLCTFSSEMTGARVGRGRARRSRIAQPRRSSAARDASAASAARFRRTSVACKAPSARGARRSPPAAPASRRPRSACRGCRRRSAASARARRRCARALRRTSADWRRAARRDALAGTPRCPARRRSSAVDVVAEEPLQALQVARAGRQRQQRDVVLALGAPLVEPLQHDVEAVLRGTRACRSRRTRRRGAASPRCASSIGSRAWRSRPMRRSSSMNGTGVLPVAWMTAGSRKSGWRYGKWRGSMTSKPPRP